MQYLLHAPASLSGTVSLPASKSISNRALILNALSGGNQAVGNLADCDDTNVLIHALSTDSHRLDIGAAGTSMRFLTAFLCLKAGMWELTGTERMKNRPISPLVNALRSLGATIDYLEKEGYPPLRILGGNVAGGTIEIDGSISSQYLSALMMAGPCMRNGLNIDIKGTLISEPYARMTIEMMALFGVHVHWNGQTISIDPQHYKPVPFTVESDWSAASYWYEMLSLAGKGSLFLNGLEKDSLQGDSTVADYFSELGVATVYEPNGVSLHASSVRSTRFEADLTKQPDLAQTLVMTCALKGIPFNICGLRSLRIKETDRIAALVAEGRKLGFYFSVLPETGLSWAGERGEPQAEPVIDTYEDHRMAMSFAPAALVLPSIRIREPQVVSKSYPGFWNDLASIGFSLQQE